MQGSIIKRQGKKGTSWAIRFTCQDGKRHYRTIGSRRIDAEKELARIMSEVHDGEYREIKAITVNELSQKWLNAKENSVRSHTFRSYRQHLKGHINTYFGYRKLKSINIEEIEAFKAYLLKQGMSGATAGKYLLTLRMMFKTAVIWGYMRDNPAGFVQRPNHKRPEMDFLTPVELEKLIKAADRHHRPLLMTACYTGMRRGELLGLKWEDLDFNNNRIYVRRTLQNGKFYEPKSISSRRGISIPDILIGSLKEHQLRQAVELDKNDCDLVFPNDVGKPMDGRNMVQRIFMATLATAGLRKVRFHDLRHSYASALISKGENPKFVQKQLGHSSIQVTMDIYGHLLPEVEKEAPSRIEAALATSSK